KGAYFVAAAEIEWVDTASNYVRLHTGTRLHLVRETMTAFETRLDPERFMRIHRSAIVRIDQVVRIEPEGHGRYRVTLRDGTVLLSSPRYGGSIRKVARD